MGTGGIFTKGPATWGSKWVTDRIAHSVSSCPQGSTNENSLSSDTIVTLFHPMHLYIVGMDNMPMSEDLSSYNKMYDEELAVRQWWPTGMWS